MATKVGAEIATEVVGIVAVNSIEFVEATLKCHHDKQVGVTLRDAADNERIVAAKVARVVSPGRTSGWGRGKFTPVSGDEVAQILFTSGTTGANKGIALTRGNIANTTKRLTDVMRLDGSVREYVGSPVYYSFGLFRCRVVSASGGEYFVPANGFDPSEIGAMLRRGEINALSAVPSQWRVLLEHRDLVAPAGRSMKWIEIGSQSMSRAEKEELKRLFPNAVIVQHYGLTEASRTTFLKIHEESGEALESVGRAEGGAQIDIDSQGRIRIRGPHVAAYRIHPSGFLPLAERDGWFTTSDIGSIRDGRLYFEGRADDLINCGGIKLFPESIEERLHALLGEASELAVSRTPDPIRGDGILVSYVGAPATSDGAVRAAAVKAAESLGINAAGAIRLQPVEAIPRTETGKVRRQALIERFAATGAAAISQGAASSAAANAPAVSLEDRLERMWSLALRVESIGPNSSFFELGGDLASARKLIPQMEQAGVSPAGVHGLLDGLTIAEIVALSEPDVATEPEVAALDPVAALEQQITEIWRTGLGRPDVARDQSFYDIGGDSLSAITVALQMERSGLDPALARGILAGKTIAGLASEMAAKLAPAPAPAAAPVDPSVAIEAQITDIWRTALGRPDVARDQSFYDIGGDSLSAITVALQMERSGLDPALARGILAGKTIADLAREMAAKSAPAPAAPVAPPAAARLATPTAAQTRVTPRSMPKVVVPPAKTPIAELSESLNFVKGIVLLCMLSSHWLPVYIDHFAGANAGKVRLTLAPLFSLGSPTLAFVFGLGIPVFFLRQYLSSKTAFGRTIKTLALLLGAGLLIGGLADVIATSVSGAAIGPTKLVHLLYGPFVYFLPATLSLPLWIKRLRIDDVGILRVFFSALILYVFYIGMARVLPQQTDSVVLTALRDLLVGHWSLLQMGAISLFGAGVGLIIDRRLRNNRGMDQFFGYGLVMLIGGVVMSLAAFDFKTWFQFPKDITLWSVFAYAGIALMIIARFERVMRSVKSFKPARELLEIVCSLGVVLFPLYVIQSTVYHSSSIISTLTGMSFVQAITICISLFLLVAAYPVGRVYRLYYGRFWGARGV